MQKKFPEKSYSHTNDDTNFKELLFILLEGKWIIISFTILTTIVASIYSLSLPNIYKSEALIAPVDPSSAISGAIQSYSGLASIAGINLPNNTNDADSKKAIKKIESLSFFKNNILKKINLPDLMAVNSWDPKTNKIAYREGIYNESTNTWIRDNNKMPSAQESFKVFIKKHLNVMEDTRTGFVTISIKHQSPYIAQEWTNLVVNEVNEFYRQKSKLESEKAVSYLNKQISMTDLSEIKEVLAQLLQEETKKLTLIEANEFYVFDYIDPPVVMEKKSKPNRTLICILSALLGIMISVLYVLIRHYIFNKKS